MKKPNKSGAFIPSPAELRALAETPARVWGLAKLALWIWVAFCVLNLLLRVAETVARLIRRRKGVAEEGAGVSAARPAYALINLNFCDSPKPAGGADA